MNPNLCRLRLRPRGPLELADLSMCLVREHLRSFAVLTLVMVIPLWVVLSVLAWALEGHWAPAVIAVLLGPVIQPPFTLLTGRLLFSKEVSLKEVRRSTLEKLGNLIGVAFMEATALILGVGSCGALAIITLPTVAFVMEATLLERVSPGHAFRRSSRLSGARPINSMAAVGTRLGLGLWLAAVFETGGQQLVGFVLQLGEPFGTVSGGDVTPYVLLGILVSHAASAVVRMMLYVDTRTRAEGWDLQVGLRAAGLGK